MMGRRIIDLDKGGCAYLLLEEANKLCKQYGKDWTLIQADMVSGSYTHLVSVFRREFGQWVQLVNNGKE